jgi:transcriptional regulator with XRE-family HTH domain
MEQLLDVEKHVLEVKKEDNELALFEFGQELKRIRRAKKLTQKRLHELTGIDDTVISDLENGNYTPSLVIIRQLADGLGINPFELIAPYYGIPLPGFNVKGQQALEKIRDIIGAYYHLELNEQEAEHLREARQRRRQAEREEAALLADMTPHPTDPPKKPKSKPPKQEGQTKSTENEDDSTNSGTA